MRLSQDIVLASCGQLSTTHRTRRASFQVRPAPSACGADTFLGYHCVIYVFLLRFQRPHPGVTLLAEKLSCIPISWQVLSSVCDNGLDQALILRAPYVYLSPVRLARECSFIAFAIFGISVWVQSKSGCYLLGKGSAGRDESIAARIK